MGETNVTIKLKTEKKEALKRISDKTGVQMGSLVRKLIYDFIDQEERKEAA